MAYRMPNSAPSRPSTPQLSGYPSQLPNRQQYSRSPPPHAYLPPNYPMLHPQSFSTPRRLRSPPPCSPLPFHYQQQNPSPLYGYVSSGYTGDCAQGLPYGEQGHHHASMMPASYHCAEILNVELDSPTKKPSAAAALVERLGWHPIAHQELIPYTLLLQMFQHLYGNRLESVKFITMDLLRIADPGIVSCRAAVCRFDKRDTWRVYKSRPGPHDRFYCAPHIEIILPFFPTRAAAKGVIEAIQNSWAPLGKHMQPAYKFRTRTYSWKFEPGMVYESVNAGHLIAKPIIHEHQQDEITQEDEEQGEQPDGNLKLITYPDQKIEEERFETDPGDWPKTLDDIKEEIRSGPNKNQCKELVKSTLADQFKLDPRRITVWFWTREVQQSDGKWYPWGSLDNTHGLVLASREVDQCKEGDARRRVRRNSRSSRDAEEKEPRDIAPTIRIIMPVERTDFAKNDENVNGLKECVDRIRLQLSAPSAFHSRAAFCISWKKERREFADWFVPQVIYKPTGDGDDYVLQSTLGSEK